MRAGDPAAHELLRHGRLDVQGRLVEASNATLFCAIEADGVQGQCVYKPVRGERPLWDFPDGTLAGREVASYLLSEAIGWGLIPPTLLRDGPFGPGMVQLWVDTEEDSQLVDIVVPDEVPDGWLAVLRAQDHHGDPVVLAHADHPQLQRLAVLDVVINNADRKGGHILHAPDGRVLGVDHGVSLNTDDKLRTVLWGWIGDPLPDEAVDRLSELRALLEGDLAAELAEHITPKEIQAVNVRIERLLETGIFPAPSGEWPAIPWPAF
ncbi:phosphatidylinositol kinase [Saccharopolyspora subtropica]|uniref:Phosphatidylinositol kinase n=1 Tax=Saccharopolyspora thermophila TaxID=89367 RepID=A0A917K175_9PSEU|nr:SCO1664 family protein [Saccharopolyspora subtropica]GGI95772.1 phosphatidylinositol kinase [Saccharopolyspora subtropica]